MPLSFPVLHISSKKYMYIIREDESENTKKILVVEMLNC